MNARDRKKYQRLCDERGLLVMASFSRRLTRSELARRKAIEAELARLEAPDWKRTFKRMEGLNRALRATAVEVKALIRDLAKEGAR